MPIDNEVYDREGGGWWDENNPLNILHGSMTPGRLAYFSRVLAGRQNLDPADLGALDVVLGGTSDDVGAALLRVSRELRGKGLATSMSPRPEKPGKLRKAAEDRGARFAVWLEAGQFSLWQREGDTTERGLDADGLVKLLAERAR